ncbi:hypothetical protein [Methylorubrum populi]|uniref:hypothetical protein n=1 Tax=Methylorubrum populi TaxID=223967 RepID=UPI003F65B12A
MASSTEGTDRTKFDGGRPGGIQAAQASAAPPIEGDDDPMIQGSNLVQRLKDRHAIGTQMREVVGWDDDHRESASRQRLLVGNVPVGSQDDVETPLDRASNSPFSLPFQPSFST